VRLGALLVGLVGGLGILTLAGLVLVLVPAALPASARSLVPGWALPAEPSATTGPASQAPARPGWMGYAAMGCDRIQV